MPFISGTALTRQAKAVQPLLQAAFLSGYDDFEYAKSGIEDGIVAYLLKPISMTELTAELEKIHKKIVPRLASLTDHRGPEERQLMTASLLLDEFCRRGEIISAWRRAASRSRTAVRSLLGPSGPGAQTADVLAAAERILSRYAAAAGSARTSGGPAAGGGKRIRGALWRTG